jgi:hypothetical protein
MEPKVFECGFLFLANYLEGKCGVLRIFNFDLLEVYSSDSPQGLGLVYQYKVFGGKVFVCANEPQDLEEEIKEVDPIYRTNRHEYIGFRHKDLNLINTSNGGRFLLPKSMANVDFPITLPANRFDYYLAWTNKEDLEMIVSFLLEKIGAPSGDILLFTGIVSERF